jgi:hypothetical protein
MDENMDEKIAPVELPDRGVLPSGSVCVNLT